MKQNGYLGGGGGEVMRVSLYNKKKHRLLIRNIDNLSLGLRSRLDLVLSCTRFFFSSFVLLTSGNSEMRQWQSFLYHALARALSQ